MCTSGCGLTFAFSVNILVSSSMSSIRFVFQYRSPSLLTASRMFSGLVTVTKPENILLAVSKDGDLYWNTKRIDDIDELTKMLTEKAKIKPQPEVHIRGDANTRYESIGRVVFACQRAGIVKVGFITEPPPNQ